MSTATPEHVRTSVDIEVRYVETDRMGFVHHSVYLVWFEVARTRLCSATGFHYADIEALGYDLVVTGSELRFVKPVTYGETVRVECRVEQSSRRGLRLKYRVERGRELIASGTTRHIWVSRRTRRPTRLPPDLATRFRELG